eukprot:1936976-Pyramimonas_sp.AAC.1
MDDRQVGRSCRLGCSSRWSSSECSRTRSPSHRDRPADLESHPCGTGGVYSTRQRAPLELGP